MHINNPPSENQRLANLLGALGLGLFDRISRAVGQVSGHAGETSAAIVTIGANEGMLVGRLAEALHLSQAGTVRLVDRLEAEGLAERRVGEDARSRALHLTEKGKAQHARLLAARSAVLGEVIAGLDASEQAALEAIAHRLLDRMTTDVACSFALCRLCDDAVCLPGGCPVEDKAQQLSTKP